MAGLLDHRSLRRAVVEWPDHVPPSLRYACERVARRVCLGAPVQPALAAEPSLAPSVANIHHRSATAVGSALLDEANRLRRRDEEQRSIAAHVSGMRLSARIVGFMPLGTIPLVAGSGSLEVAGTHGLLAAAGICLSLAGARWMSRLVPCLPARPPVVHAAEVVAREIRGGAGMRSALDMAAGASRHPELLRARARSRLGAPWREALGACEDQDLRAFGALVRSLMERGLPAEPFLRGFASAVERRERSRFEMDLRKAPVRMALPLTLCILPACVLLGLGPFLRSITGSG